MSRDPRHYQIAVLASLLVYGMTVLDFGVGAGFVAAVLGSAVGVQWILARGVGIAPEWRSAAISGLSLCLLFRTNSLWLAALAAVVAVGSKFVLRVDGKHVFNPTAFALVLMLLLGDGRVWVSPGQWGNVAFFGFLYT